MLIKPLQLFLDPVVLIVTFVITLLMMLLFPFIKCLSQDGFNLLFEAFIDNFVFLPTLKCRTLLRCYLTTCYCGLITEC